MIHADWRWCANETIATIKRIVLDARIGRVMKERRGAQPGFDSSLPCRVRRGGREMPETQEARREGPGGRIVGRSRRRVW